ncbi:nucleotidyl transferase AbiEii/AbiGii toxin family protein [Desulfofundulus thermosubterraneus]|uniref:Nucleotidyl transferase AbiEii toxin, Type IV TA system n=1 Tax=Desulfofundulus thermosubterraneus DSM 16057 TaxID=1121432 RepID=A0A1M6CVT8_9FIRM|nr:nucleotidyl transferase AbiEii/AbiGii toxin family protein [Desulfofundulus thermosubterraneus]SHI65003.1 Nucleotidyl transferase AbiEii toxin, Type IV TA system [Desulfofundulus thermosubterraneus DSM 16057]
MFASALPQRGQKALELLSSAGLLRDFYLAGGTALALHLGHRLSEDLDFFSPFHVDTLLLKQRLQEVGQFLLLEERWGTLHGIFRETKISFLYYRYPLLFPPALFLDCKVACPQDIAPMKIEAIASRGSKKDFFDLYFINREIADLRECLELYRRKFAGSNFNLYHVLKSLTYFADAEKERDPVLLRDVGWDQVKKHFERVVPPLLREVCMD